MQAGVFLDLLEPVKKALDARRRGVVPLSNTRVYCEGVDDEDNDADEDFLAGSEQMGKTIRATKTARAVASPIQLSPFGGMLAFA